MSNRFEFNWRQIAAVQVGGVVCLPIFMIGHALATNYGIASALLAAVAGNLVLLVCGTAAAAYAAETRKNTAEAAADAFGDRGKGLFAIALAASMAGWFAVQLDLMAATAGPLLGVADTRWLNAAMGGLLIAFGLLGFKGMQRIASVCLPLLAGTIAYAAFEASKSPVTLNADTLSAGGMVIAISAALGVVVDMPTFCRQAKTVKDAVIAAAVLFAVAMPLLEGVGIYLAAHGLGDNIVDSLTGINPSSAWKLWIAAFIILAGWTTNTANLYSAVVSARSAAGFLSNTQGYLLIGSAGTVLSLAGIQDNLFILLEGIGAILAAAGGPMLLHQLSRGRTDQAFNAAGLVMGVGAAALSFCGIGIVGVPLVDAFAVAAAGSASGLLFTKQELACHETT